MIKDLIPRNEGPCSGVAKSESDYWANGCCCTCKTPIIANNCTGFYLIYTEIINFVAQNTADHSNFDKMLL